MNKSFIFLVSLIITAGAALAYPSTIDEGALLRTGPSEAEEVKIDLPRSYPLKVLKRSGGWALVTDWLNCQGWVESNLITGESTGGEAVKCYPAERSGDEILKPDQALSGDDREADLQKRGLAQDPGDRRTGTDRRLAARSVFVGLKQITIRE